jgi:uncharacterized membrane protein
MVEAVPTPGTTGAIKDNIAAALAYVTFIPAIVFLLVEPFKRNRLIRFHSFQCIFVWIAAVVISVVLKLVFAVLSFIPLLGHLMMLLASMIIALGCAILWIVLLVKALQGEFFKLPFIGDLAERQASLADVPAD